jgi:Arc/MetJ-type ribon-helix-helix transcriptional regulator
VHGFLPYGNWGSNLQRTSSLNDLLPRALGEPAPAHARCPAVSGKITINVGFVDLGDIDLLVHEGFYSNRIDFIRTAIRNQLTAHADAVKQSTVRHTLELGLRRYSRDDLEAVKAAAARCASGSSALRSQTTSRPSLRLQQSNQLPSFGALQASKAVKALSDRIDRIE